jgi:hypothetical protein
MYNIEAMYSRKGFEDAADDAFEAGCRQSGGEIAVGKARDVGSEEDRKVWGSIDDL